MAFFRNCDPDDPLCIDECRLQKFEYLRWVRLLPGGDEDVLSYCASIGARLGKSEGYVSRRIDAFSMLLELSKVHELQLKMWHLDITRLMVIAQALSGVEKEVIEEIDAPLARFLTPKRDNQKMPGPKVIKKFIVDLLVRVEDAVEEVDSPQELAIDFYDAGNGKTGINAVVDNATASIFRDQLMRLAKAHECDDSSALLLMATQEGKSLTINLYKGDNFGELMTADGYRLSRKSVDLVFPNASRRSLEGVENVETRGYSFTPSMRAYIQARDGVCRFPGCSIRAVNCDIDHVEEYGLGGKTTARNAQCLCRRHHNLKTSKAVDCEISGDASVSWILEDGTKVVTLPEGIFSADRLFGQTFAQRVVDRIRRRKLCMRKNSCDDVPF